MKRMIPWVVGGGLLLLAMAGMDCCREARKDLREMRDRYDIVVAEKTAEKVAHDAERAALTADISAREAETSRLKAENAAQREEIRINRATIAVLQAAEPPTTPDIEAMPIVINLRAQVREFSLALRSAEEVIERQATIITKLELDKEALAKQVSLWAKDWEAEHALRLNAEANWRSVEKKYRRAQRGFSLKQLGWDGLFFCAGYFLGK